MPPAPSAPPPSAPAPTVPSPAPAPAPAARPSSAPPPEKDPKDYLSDDMDALQALSDNESDKASGKPPAKAPEKPAGEVTPPEKAEAKTVEPPPEKAPEVKPVRAAELRAAYEKLKEHVQKDLEPKIQQQEQKIKDFESKPPEDNKVILDELNAVKKRRDELESEIKYVNYTKSQEFQDKYSKPYIDAWNRAVSDFNQLTVRIPNGTDEATGEPAFKTRQATPDDLLALANMPLSEMDVKAEEMFGRSASRVIRHVEKVRELSVAQQEALDKARKEGVQRSQLTTIQQQEQQKERVNLWKKANEDLATKYPKWFAPEEGDSEGNTLLEKGFALADRLFSPTQETTPKTTGESVRLHARIRNKVANHDRLAMRLNKATKRIAELEASLAEYEESSPPAGRAGKRAPSEKTWEQQVDEEISAMDK